MSLDPAAMALEFGPRFGKLEFHSLSLVAHPYHGPWSYENDICRGCGAGLIFFKEPNDSQNVSG